MHEALVAAEAENSESTDWSGSDQFGPDVQAGYPKAAALASGGFVLVYWVEDSANPAAAGFPIRAQIHSAAGQPIGPEIQVPSNKDLYTNSYEFDLSAYAVAGLPDGGFVICYGEVVGRPFGFKDQDLFIQRFDAQGLAVGVPAQVNSQTFANQIGPEIAVLDNGGFVVTWDSNQRQDGGPKGQLFAPDGQKLGGEFLIPPPAAPSTREGQDVTALPGGGFIATWMESDPGNSIKSVKGQVFDSSGGRTGDPFMIFLSPTTGVIPSDPEIVALAGGGWVATWTTVRVIGVVSAVVYVQGQLFASDGTPVGAAFQVSETTSGGSSSRIVALADGGFAVVWQDATDGSSGGIMARFFDSSGNAPESGFVVNIHFEDIQNRPDAVALADGSFVIAWADYRGDTPGISTTVEARIFTLGADFARDDAFVTDENSVVQGNVFADNGSGADSAPTAGSLTVAAVNGSAASVGQAIMLASGALLTLNSDGSYSYNPNGAFAALAATVTGGSNIYGSDSFTYRLAGGDEATVTLTIHGRWSAPHLVLGTAVADDIDGTSLADFIFTGAGDDVLWGNGGDDWLDGEAGADRMTGGTGNDIYFVDDALDSIVEAAGEGTDEVRTALSVHVLAANVENLTAISNVAHDFRGNSGDNVITGGGGADLLRLYDGGDDIDTLVLQGPYGALTLTANVTLIENISILGGGNTNFGEPGTNRYDYVLTTHDSNFASGLQPRINGAALLAGEDFTFNGSAETNASFVVYGGKGVDTLTGGFGNDIFIYAEDRFAAGDTVNGGPGGYDGIFFRGNYTIDFNAPGYFGLMTSIENMTLMSITDERYSRGGDPAGFDYNITLADNMLMAGIELTVSGVFLMAGETMILDGSQELDGRLRLFGGKGDDTLKGGSGTDLFLGNLGADQLTGGGGVDTFRYDSTADSNAVTMDQILDFRPGTDKIDLSRVDASTLAGGDQAFSWIGSGAFTGSAGQLRAFQQGGTWILEGDVNGDSVADLVIALTLQGPTPLGQGDFLL